MKKALSLSIVIPVYNDERYLKACLDAIAAQTVMPDEVVVVDNNCTDNSMKIAARYPFVRVVKEPRQGIVHARNTGFDASRGDIIARIDTDTVLPPGWVEHVKDFYLYEAHPSQAITGGGTLYNIRAPRLNSWLQNQIVFRANRFIMGHYILWGSNMAITRGQWQAVKKHVCLRDDIHEDLDLAIHLHRLKYDITYRATLKVGVAFRRVVTDRHKFWDNLMLWPNTLKVHRLKRWIFGWVGAVFFFAISPVILIAEKSMQFIGRPSLRQ